MRVHAIVATGVASGALAFAQSVSFTPTAVDSGGAPRGIAAAGLTVPFRILVGVELFVS